MIGLRSVTATPIFAVGFSHPRGSAAISIAINIVIVVLVFIGFVTITLTVSSPFPVEFGLLEIRGNRGTGTIGCDSLCRLCRVDAQSSCKDK